MKKFGTALKNFFKKLFGFLGILILLLFLLSFSIVSYGTFSRPVKYVDEVMEIGEEYNVDPLLILSIIKVESNFREEAKSHMNAYGLMQVIPETADWINERLELNYEKPEDLYEPNLNLRMGTYYLSYLLNHFSDQDVAIAAYNGGIGNVKSWLLDEKYSKDQRTLDHIPIDEARNYVEKVNSQYQIYKIFYKDVRLEENMNRSFLTMVQNYIQTIQHLKDYY